MKCTVIKGLTVFSLLYATSCEKQAKEKQPSQSDIRQISSLAATDVTMYEPNTMKWDEIVQGYSDLDTRRRHAKLFLSIGLTEAVKDPAVAAWIEQEAPRHEDSVFYMEDLFERFPNTKQLIEKTTDPLGKFTGWTFEKVQQEMQYGKYDIKASIYLASLSNVDNSLKPIVTPGSDLSENARTKTDVVLGWHTDVSNKVTRINLWRDIIYLTKAPVFVVDGRARNIRELTDHPGPMVPMGPHPSDFDPAQPPDYANHRISITKYQIGHRYDNTSHSEFEISGKMVYTPTYNSGVNAGVRNFLREDGCYSGTTDEYELASVHKDDANNWNMITTDRFFCWMYSAVPFNANEGEYDHNPVPDPSQPSGFHWEPRKVIFFNTYENDDWPASSKPVSPEYVNGVYLNMKGRMENYDEWYQFDPNAGTITWWNQYAMRLHQSQMNVGWNFSLWTNPVKGMLEFKTTNFCNY